MGRANTGDYLKLMKRKDTNMNDKISKLPKFKYHPNIYDKEKVLMEFGLIIMFVSAVATKQMCMCRLCIAVRILIVFVWNV